MKAIGGYFELEEDNSEAKTLDGYLFNTARNALKHLIDAYRPRHIWMPAYSCHVMKEAFEDSGTTFSSYSLDQDFMPRISSILKKDEWLLYVNYFGICHRQIDELRKQYSEKLIIDNAQGFFEPHQGTLASIYSPRKFFGIADGGICKTNYALNIDFLEEDRSETRMSHLYKRKKYGPEAGYPDFIKNDASLSGLPVMQMSSVTRKILSKSNWEMNRERRLKNFRILHDYFHSINKLNLNDFQSFGSLAYPLLVENGAKIREKFIARRIFIPQYWPDLFDPEGVGDFEKSLQQDMLCLPIDQRYDEEDMNYIIEVFEAIYGK